MYKKTIAYTDYDNNQRQEDFYFNLTRAEIIEMNFTSDGGMEKMIKKITDEQDMKRLMSIFKDVIGKSYGEKSLDGKRFIKVDEVTGRPLIEKFMQTEAYSNLFVELATDADAAAAFINGITPNIPEAAAAASKETGIPTLIPAT